MYYFCLSFESVSFSKGTIYEVDVILTSTMVMFTAIVLQYIFINITINRHFSLLKVKLIAVFFPLKLCFIPSFQIFIRTALSGSGSFVLVQSLIHVRFFETPFAAAHQAPLCFTISQSLLKFMSIELGMPSNHLIFC